MRSLACPSADEGIPRALAEMADAPKILLIDIETSPNLVWTWGLWKQNVATNQIVDTSRMICFAARWLGGKRKTQFYSIGLDGSQRHEMVSQAHRLLDEADIVMGYNSAAFDLPYINRELLLEGFTPPSPYRQIDLLVTARKQFRFPSNKLAHISEALGLKGKVEHEGFPLWTKCLAGDPDAWKRMEKYNKRDVTLLAELYHLLQPWIIAHPSYAAYLGRTVCPSCGSDKLMRRGYAYTALSKYQQWCCMDCGRYCRSTHRDYGAEITSVVV